jgi:hypothetical protein
VLERDYPTINAYMVSSNIVAMQTYGIGLAVTNTTSWGTNTVTTNTANGNIQITANVSGDTVNWSSFPALNLSLGLTNGAPNAATNTPLYGWPFVQLIVGSVATNGACPTFKLITSGQ